MILFHSKLVKAILACHEGSLCLSGQVAEEGANTLSTSIRQWMRTFRDVAICQKALDILRTQAFWTWYCKSRSRSSSGLPSLDFHWDVDIYTHVFSFWIEILVQLNIQSWLAHIETQSCCCRYDILVVCMISLYIYIIFVVALTILYVYICICIDVWLLSHMPTIYFVWINFPRCFHNRVDVRLSMGT